MELLTKAIRKKMPELYSQSEKQAQDVPVIVKFFSLSTGWSWYVTEGSCILKSGEGAPLSYLDESPDAAQNVVDVTFFGLVRGVATELGYFSLNELKAARGVFGPDIERDMFFGEHTLADVMERRL